MDCTDYSFRQLRHYAGYTSHEDAATFCGVSVSTIKNWDRHGPPLVALKLFQLLNQDLSVYDPQWRGFRFEGGEIVGPNKEHAHAGHIRARRYLEEAQDYYKKHCRQLKVVRHKVALRRARNQTRHRCWSRPGLNPQPTRIILPPGVRL